MLSTLLLQCFIISDREDNQVASERRDGLLLTTPTEPRPPVGVADGDPLSSLRKELGLEHIQVQSSKVKVQMIRYECTDNNAVFITNTMWMSASVCVCVCAHASMCVYVYA